MGGEGGFCVCRDFSARSASKRKLSAESWDTGGCCTGLSWVEFDGDEEDFSVRAAWKRKSRGESRVEDGSWASLAAAGVGEGVADEHELLDSDDSWDWAS